MNKKVMAVAVASALAVPSAVAFAQTSTVQIGGSITAFYYRHSPNNPDVGQSSDIMETSEPEMYIRGQENLGGGLSAWFQCTTSMDGMIGGASAAFGICGRNSGIGFQGSWGNLFMGNWDTPEKLVFNRARGWWGGTNALTGGSAVLLQGGTASGQANPVTTVSGPTTTTPVIAGVSTIVTTAATGTTTSGNPGSFFRRQANSLNYHSPSWNGFSFNGAFSAANEQTGNPEASTLSQRMYSLGAQYASGPLYVGLGYERHSDYNPGNLAIGVGASAYMGGNDTNIILVGGYQFGGFNIRGVYSKLEYDVTNSGGLDVDGFGVFADWNIQGPHTLRFKYVAIDDTSGNTTVSVGAYVGPGTVATASNAAKLWGFGYSYAFSKRTMGSVVYTKMDSDTFSRFSKGKTTPTLGGSQTTTGFVLQHRF
jgi:predicted porin